MLRGIKVRLYPNTNQTIYASKLLGTCRFVYNDFLSLKKDMYDLNKTSLDAKDISKYLHNYLLKSDKYTWMTEHNTKVIKQSMRDMFTAYDNFFKTGSGFPKFKCKNDNKQTCRFPIEAISSRNNYETKKITLTNELKNLKFKCSPEYRTLLNQNKDNIKSATLTKTRSGEYTLTFLVDVKTPIKQRPKPINYSIGIDLGVKTFVVTSKGDSFENLKVFTKNKKKLAKIQRTFSKKQKGSKNKEKERIKLAKINQKLVNQKTNYIHEVTNKLINENQIIGVESLNVKGMMQNHCLARAVQEVSMSEFIRVLAYKGLWFDRDVINISQWFPSTKKCNHCHELNQNLTLSDREWVCTNCGAIHDRDVNAALNIEEEALRIFTMLNDKKDLEYISDTLMLPTVASDNQDIKPKRKRKISTRSAESTSLESKSVDPR
jgi:putative transposase